MTNNTSTIEYTPSTETIEETLAINEAIGLAVAEELEVYEKEFEDLLKQYDEK